MKTIRYVQGDVILKPIKAFPLSGEEDKQTKTLTLAYGEVTGHSHLITSGEAEMIKVNMDYFIKAITAITITHEEHNPVTCPPGFYKVEIARETDWLTKTIRRVAD